MTTAFGAFGKMPALGDFFRINLGSSVVDPWDLWLQAGMLEARASLGDRWDACYMSAPIWRFTLSPGLIEQGGAIGVMMASVDRVGRQFPLTLLAAPLHELDPVRDHFADPHLFEALEAVALDALDDEMTREVLTERLGAIVFSYSHITHDTQSPGARAFECSGNPAAALAAEELRHGYSRPSIWSAAHDGKTRVLICEGLPDAAWITGLFDAAASIWGGEETGASPGAEAVA
jgi:type VI secretion system protein ImpM